MTKTESRKQDEFKNGSRRRQEAEFGAQNTSASLPRRLRLLRRLSNSALELRGKWVAPEPGLDVRALAGRLRHPFGQARDGGNALVILRVHALVHHVQDFIDKPVEADERGQLAGAPGRRQQFLSAHLTEFKGGGHGEVYDYRYVHR